MIQFERKLIYLIIVFFVATGHALAQQDTATQYIHGLPVSEDDTVRNFPAYDYAPKTKTTVVMDKDIPKSLRETLNSKEQYRGWEKLPVLRNVNTGVYTIRIADKRDTTYFGLNENGSVVKYGRDSVDDR